MPSESDLMFFAAMTSRARPPGHRNVVGQTMSPEQLQLKIRLDNVLRMAESTPSSVTEELVDSLDKDLESMDSEHPVLVSLSPLPA